MEQKRTIPLWEISVTLLSLYICGFFFFFPNILSAEGGQLYENMQRIAPQMAWALFFLVGALTKAVGLVFNIIWLRMVGLAISTAIYSTISVCYLMFFPNIGAGLFVVITFMSLLSIFYVKATEL